LRGAGRPSTLCAVHYLYLSLAIGFEVAATTALQASAGFTRPLQTTIALVGYAVAFYCLSLTLRTMPVGIAYAIWSAVGIVLIAAIGWVFYRQTLDAPAVIGIALIIAGVLIVNLFSRSIAR
jgi:small multidrug resistance pump